ncbi:MAG: translational GTPase TypA [Anaerolineae bacterium]|nr:translational GTPase TypA [Anaerolineae bacterium]
MPQRDDLRNIAIIAHVDHGKTTLVDAMLKQSHVFRENQTVAERVMDSNALERERGITILAKNTAITYRGVKINIVDTPGHADFGGEVERVLNMVDGVLLLVDAVDGPMPQTRFVLRKALELGLRAVVVINKVDRPQSRLDYVANATFDLFIDLGATDEQADFPIIYTNALTGQASLTPTELGPNLQPLFDTILSRVPPPHAELDAPTQMRVNLLAYDDYKGRLATGRLFAGDITKAQEVMVIGHDGQMRPGKITQVFIHQGLQRQEVQTVSAGEIVTVAGLPDVGIGETIADAVNPIALPSIRVEEPTLRMMFLVNTSPFAGREGTNVTSRKLRERLYQELERDVALRVEDTDSADQFSVSGRGELHLAILIETMRREGFELAVSKPEVIYHEGEDGERLEPMEQVSIEVPEETMGIAVEMLGKRRGRMLNMHPGDMGMVHLEYIVPTRGLLGFRSAFMTATRGEGIVNALFGGYEPYQGEIETRDHGSLVAMETGPATSYALEALEDRGTYFVRPTDEVYEGQIVGQHIRDSDLGVNVTKRKVLNNIRSSTKDSFVTLKAPRVLSLDDAIEYIAEDELVEVTPKSIRLRKRLLDTQQRLRQEKRAKLAEAVVG